MSDAEAIREIAQPLADGSGCHDSLLELIGDARFALLRERWHGTHEFCFDHTRRPIVKRIRCLALPPFRIR